MEDLDPTAVPDSNNAAVRAAGQGQVGLHRDYDLAVVLGGHVEDVQALDTEQLISPRTACDRGPTSTVGHVRVSLLAAWSPPIVEALTGCPDCGVVAVGHGRRVQVLHDAPSFGRPVGVRWAKRIWRCPEPAFPRLTWTEEHAFAAPRAKLTAWVFLTR